MLQLFIGGGDNPDIHINFPGAAHGCEAGFLDGPQELYLQKHRQLTDFIHKNRAGVGSLKQAGLICHSPVNAPLTWPKNSLSMSMSGIPPQLTTTKGLSLRLELSWMARAISSLPVPLSPLMSTLVFCGADLAYPLVNGLHARAVANDAIEMQMTFKFR